MATALLTRNQLAKLWNYSNWKVDRLRQSGLFPWIELAGKDSKKPMPRFRLADVISFEKKTGWTSTKIWRKNNANE